ncbi:protein phosphatase Mn(2+)-dependent 1K-like [Apostichopus japonicus]|uniref:protein phosphatase Mn(2+)-dependent 1K-like n=1 Tax=Stichopus japonicus TaxID=307972 RepID=UPI003AB79D6E
MFPSVGLITIARRLKAPTFRCTFKSSPISSFHSSASSNDEWANFGTWDDRIQEPILLKQSIKHGVPIPHVSLEHAGLASIVGRRKVNEDRILLKELEADILCFGIFDGHAGALAAEFTKEHLVECIHSHLSKEHDLQKVLEAAFLDVNKKLSEHISGLAQKQSASVKHSGTTATVCLLRNGNELALGHVGDSRAILFRDGQAIRMTTDHDPEYNHTEKERIIECKGFITSNSLGTPLVNGVLTMTRSIGDFYLKQYGVIATPETRSIKVKHGHDSFLLLITDGVHFSMSDGEICDTIRKCHTPQQAATTLTDQAIQYGSDDNASVIVIPFGQWGKDSSTTLIPALRWQGRGG